MKLSQVGARAQILFLHNLERMFIPYLGIIFAKRVFRNPFWTISCPGLETSLKQLPGNYFEAVLALAGTWPKEVLRKPFWNISGAWGWKLFLDCFQQAGLEDSLPGHPHPAKPQKSQKRTPSVFRNPLWTISCLETSLTQLPRNYFEAFLARGRKYAPRKLSGSHFGTFLAPGAGNSS